MHSVQSIGFDIGTGYPGRAPDTRYEKQVSTIQIQFVCSPYEGAQKNSMAASRTEGSVIDT